MKPLKLAKNLWETIYDESDRTFNRFWMLRNPDTENWYSDDPIPNMLAEMIE